MKLHTILATTSACTLLMSALPVQADPADRPARKWSQPSYDRQDEAIAAPEMESFPGIVDDEDALFDGDGRLIDRRGSADR